MQRSSTRNWPDMTKLKHFTEDEVTAVKEGFDVFDHGRQLISVNEMLELIESISAKEKYPTLYSIISRIAEANPKGKNFKHFMETFEESLGNVDTKAGLKNLFDTLDIEEKQYLDEERLGSIATEIGEKLQKDDIDYLIEEGYNCPSGKVGSDAFIKTILKITTK